MAVRILFRFLFAWGFQAQNKIVIVIFEWWQAWRLNVTGGIMSENMDFELEWVYAQYENGESITSIAAEIGRSEAYVYSKMHKKPDKYEDVKQAREATE